MKCNYKIVLAYDGSRYDGWQKQGNTDNTIQGKLEAVIGRMLGEAVEVCGSGRTDAGVHALAQTANFHGETSMTEGEIKDYLNRYLPEDIGILSVEKISPRFHSRLSACEKTYLYQIETGNKANVFERKYVYCLGKTLDLERMRRGAALLLGERDFKSFCSNKRMKKSTIRNLISISIEEKGSKVLIRYRGNGFLYNMVRILTGTLIEIGLGDRKAEDVIRILEKKDRAAAGPTAPAQGLFLEKVEYKGKDS